jgi:hypothetical protein
MDKVQDTRLLSNIVLLALSASAPINITSNLGSIQNTTSLSSYSMHKIHHVTKLQCIQDISHQQHVMCPRHIMSEACRASKTIHTLTPRAMQENPRTVLTIRRREDIMRTGTPCMPHMVGMWLTSILGSASCASNTQPTDADSRPRVTEFTPRNRQCLQQKRFDTKTNL